MTATITAEIDEIDEIDDAIDVSSAPRRARVLALGVVAPVVCGVAWLMAKSMLLYPKFLDVHAWVFSRDAFVALPAARYVANGAVFYMYEPTASLGSPIGYPYPPALPIVLAPFAWIGDRFGLTDNLLQPVARPGLFLIFGPVVAILGIAPLLASVGRALREHLDAARIIAVQWAVGLATVSVTTVYLHPEDTIAGAALIGGAHATATGRPRRAAVLAGVAILFKQWAAIPAIVLLVAAPARQRLVFAFYAYAVPALCMVPFLLAETDATRKALTGTQATISLGHEQLWSSLVFRGSELVSATPLRLAWLAMAIGIAYFVRGRATLPVLFGALGLVMLARVLCEPTIFAYYFGPAFAFAILCAALLRLPIGLRTFGAVALQVWCGFHHVPDGLWWLVLGAGVTYVCAPLIIAMRHDVAPAPVRQPAVPVPA